MKPTKNMVFAKEAKVGSEMKKNQFKVVQTVKNYEVTAVGEDVTTCHVGDFILFNGSDAERYSYNGEEFVVVSEDAIKGVHA